MAQLNALLQDEARTGGVLGVAVQAMNTLAEMGLEAEAREAMTLIIAAFKDHPDPAVAAEAARLMEQSVFVNAEIEPKFGAVVANREGAEAAFVAEMTKILAQPNLGSLTLEKGARFIGVLQQTGHYELARKLCQMFQNAYANCSDAELKQGSRTADANGLATFGSDRQAVGCRGSETGWRYLGCQPVPGEDRSGDVLWGF